MPQTLTLQGGIKITENGEYNLVIPSDGILSQSNYTLQNEEVFVFVENLDSVIIYLPMISDFNGSWNCKIYIVSKGITIVRTTIPREGQALNYINYYDEVQVSNGSTAYFHISNSENYACWLTEGGYIPPTTKAIVTLQYESPSFQGYQIGDVIQTLTVSPFEPRRFYLVTNIIAVFREVQYELSSYEGSDVTLIQIGTMFILNNSSRNSQSTVLSVIGLKQIGEKFVSSEISSIKKNVSSAEGLL